MTKLSREEYLASLATKVTAAGVLFFNEQGEILVLQPSYKEAREIPGGMVEGLESPRQAAKRETLEEIGLDVEIGRLLCIDNKRIAEHVDSYQMIFDGGVLSADQIAAITPCPKEIAHYSFLPEAEALVFLGEVKTQRIKMALHAKAENTTYYLENGRTV